MTAAVACISKPISTSFLPTSIAGCQLWLRGDLGITLGTGVSTWADQSGVGDTGRNAVQATGSKQPTINATDSNFNHQQTLNFASASSQELTTGSWSVALATPATFFVVGKDDGTASTQTYYFVSTGSTFLCGTNNGGAGVDLYSGGSFLTIPGGNTSSSRAVCAVYDGASSAGYLNSHTAGVTGNAGTSTMGGPLSIGSSSGIYFLNGTIAEVIAYNSHLSAGNITTVLGYLGTRYGIAIA